MSALPITRSERDGVEFHPAEVVRAHEVALRGSSTTSRFVETHAGRRVHVIEAGTGRPAILIHGSGPSGLLFLPLMERLEGVRAIALDRPGFGLSDPEVVAAPYRDFVVDWLGRVLDLLALDEVALVGNSMGGTCALWFALAHPQRVHRLVLLAAPPLAPGSRVPPPLLQVAHPDPTAPPREMPSPSRETVVGSMAGMGEAETIVLYPELIDALVAAGGDRVAADATMREFRAIFAPTGWRPELQIRREDLGRVSVPTMLVWGERDPLGGADLARQVADSMIDARLRLVPAGHAPWLGDPGGIAAMVAHFLR